MDREIKTHWHLQKEEILLLNSIYCEEGECVVSRLSSSSDCSPPTATVMTVDDLSSTENLSEDETIHIHVKLHTQTHSSADTSVEVTLILPSGYPKYVPPSISITSKHLSGKHLMKLTENATLHSKMLLPEACLYDTLQMIKDGIMGMRWSSDPASSAEEICEGSRTTLATTKPVFEDTAAHICIARLDHMNREQKYFKLLHSWAQELQITGKVVKMGSHGGIYVVLLGTYEAPLIEFVRRWKTRNVDVDSRGRPCKEKMMSLLCQKQLQLSDDTQLGFGGLVFAECFKLAEIYDHFTDEAVKELIKKLFF